MTVSRKPKSPMRTKPLPAPLPKGHPFEPISLVEAQKLGIPTVSHLIISPISTLDQPESGKSSDPGEHFDSAQSLIKQ